MSVDRIQFHRKPGSKAYVVKIDGKVAGTLKPAGPPGPMYRWEYCPKGTKGGVLVYPDTGKAMVAIAGGLSFSII